MPPEEEEFPAMHRELVDGLDRLLGQEAMDTAP
jgi:hypothetical protein